MPEQALNCQMDVCTAHWPTSRCQDLDDRSLHDAIAESPRRYLRLRTYARLDRLIWQGLKHRFQGRREVCKVS